MCNKLQSIAEGIFEFSTFSSDRKLHMASERKTEIVVEASKWSVKFHFSRLLRQIQLMMQKKAQIILHVSPLALFSFMLASNFSEVRDGVGWTNVRTEIRFYCGCLSR
jgi:hypothetical protein